MGGGGRFLCISDLGSLGGKVVGTFAADFFGAARDWLNCELIVSNFGDDDSGVREMHERARNFLATCLITGGDFQTLKQESNRGRQSCWYTSEQTGDLMA